MSGLFNDGGDINFLAIIDLNRDAAGRGAFDCFDGFHLVLPPIFGEGKDSRGIGPSEVIFAAIE